MPHFIFIQQISLLNILNMLYNLHLFPSKCRLFHNATLFGFCITHILNTERPKIRKQTPLPKGKIRAETRVIEVCKGSSTAICFYFNTCTVLFYYFVK